jgi:hypothetical protein
MSLGFVGVPALLDTTTDASQLLRQSSRMLHYGHLIMLGIAVGTSMLHATMSLQQHAAGKCQKP